MAAGNKLSRVLFRELYRACAKYDRNPLLKATFRNPYYTGTLHHPLDHPFRKFVNDNEEECKVFQKIFQKGRMYKPVVSYRKVLKEEFIGNRNATGQELDQLQDNAFAFLRLLSENERLAQKHGILKPAAHTHEGELSIEKPSEPPSLRVLQDYIEADIVPGMYLVAHPAVADEHFARTVVLITGVTPDKITGLVINRSVKEGGVDALVSKYGGMAFFDDEFTSDDEYEEYDALHELLSPRFGDLLAILRNEIENRKDSPKSPREKLIEKLLSQSKHDQDMQNCGARYGGPEGLTRSPHILHTADGVKGSQKVVDNIYIGGDRDDISQKLQDGGVKSSQFNGVSTWTPRQLLEELDRGQWFAVRDDDGHLNDLVFPSTESNPETDDAISLQKWSHVMEMMGGEYADFKNIPDIMKKQYHLPQSKESTA